MIYWLYFIGVIILAALISTAITFAYLWLLSVLEKRYGCEIRVWVSKKLTLLKEFYNQGTKTRQEGNNKINPPCKLNSFNNRLDRSSNIGSAFRNRVKTPDISGNSHYQQEKENTKNGARNLKRCLHLNRIIKGGKRGGQPKANKT